MPDDFAALPRLDLARLPTPIETAPRLAASLGVAALWVKREDLSGTAFGGNKLRQLSLILGAACAEGADTVIATAGVQSNFCRALAGAAASLGLGCELLLRGSPAAKREGNLLLDHIFGAKVAFTAATDPWDPAIRVELEAMAERARAAGKRPTIVQLTGDSASLGVAGWVAGADEVLAQIDAAAIAPTHMVVACGSALTLAGLALGFKWRGRGPRLFGVSVQQPVSRLRPWIAAAAAQGAAMLGLDVALAETDFDLVEAVGPGYGQPSPEAIAAVRLAGRSQGWVLDPVYTGKALAGLIAACEVGHMPRTAAPLFLHSGGAPGLFVNAASFGEAS
jgi:1-aminocyclopropane-1-carboxylate deaminase/D-cysteine desulfhydrase-like pyridoxal-dependent ACC family enzyme